MCRKILPTAILVLVCVVTVAQVIAPVAYFVQVMWSVRLTQTDERPPEPRHDSALEAPLDHLPDGGLALRGEPSTLRDGPGSVKHLECLGA